jgi:two-component system chemotaxis response regulator CheY
MYSVLIVDDSEIIRSVLQRTLNMAKIPLSNVYHAANGREAMDILDNYWIDLVMTDLNMPVMSGFEIIDIMHKRNDLCLIPIVVISTEGSALRIEELKDRGVKGYLRKPFTPESICTTLRQILGE